MYNYWEDCCEYGCGGLSVSAPVSSRTTTEEPEPIVTDAPQPDPTPGPAEPEPEPEPEPTPAATTNIPQETTKPPATGAPTEPAPDNKDCHKQKEKFAAKYGEKLGISNPVLDKMCRFANKQCNDNVCYCVRPKGGKPKYKKLQFPKDEDFDCDCKSLTSLNVSINFNTLFSFRFRYYKIRLWNVSIWE